MSIDKKFLNLFSRVTEKAAIGASKFIGKKDKIAADKGAVDPMRRELNRINMQGTVVIGEGEMDEAPMLYIGEKVGTLNGPKFDIAVDPLEGTKFTANNQPNAFSVLVVADQIDKQYGDKASQFFLASLANVKNKTGGNINTTVSFRLNQIKANRLNNR